jgi:amidophosphoribosyltransferase
MSLDTTIDSEHPAVAYPQHECGIFAVFGHPNAAVLTYYGLFALQHRGQESAGIVTSNETASTFQLHRDMGLVSQVFGAEELERLTPAIPPPARAP